MSCAGSSGAITAPDLQVRTSADGDLDRHQHDPRRPRVRRPAYRARIPRSDPQCRPSHRELEEPPGLDVHRRPRSGASPRTGRGRPIFRPSRGRGSGDRARPSGGEERTPARDVPLGPRARGAEHGARRVGAQHRERAGDGLRSRPRGAPSGSPGRPPLRLPALVRLSSRPEEAIRAESSRRAGVAQEIVREDRW